MTKHSFLHWLILWLGWFGFNPGSTMAAMNGTAIAHILVNTNLAAATGALGAMATAWVVLGKPDLSMILNGCLAGLVAITAPCAYVSIEAGALIGLVGGVLVVLAVVGFDKIRIDDPVGALSVHLVIGVWGTLALGIFHDDEIATSIAALATGLSPMAQFLVQLKGVVYVGAFTFAISLAVWGGDLVTLRHELTPSLARMVAARQNELAYPVRWWSFGPFWRYEQPQKGRTREFFQWNIDMLGVDSPDVDAELVAVGAEFFKSVGLSAQQIVIKLNSRKLIEEQIARLGVTPDRLDGIYRLIDKLDKLPAEKWRAYGIDDIGLSAEQIDRLSELVGNRELWKESADLTAFFNAINDLGVADYVEYDPSIIHGLAYYTGVVFEARDRSGEFRAILGGGRYDNLVADVGGEPLGGIGFALGDVVMGLVLEKYGLKPGSRLPSRTP